MLDQRAKLRTREQITFEVVELGDHRRFALQSFDEGEDELVEFAAERMMRIGAGRSAPGATCRSPDSGNPAAMPDVTAIGSLQSNRSNISPV